MYTLIEYTPFYVFGILTLISTIYLTYLFKKVRGILIFKVVTILLFLSVSVNAFLIETFPDAGLFMLKYILPLLGILFVILGIYNKVILRKENDKSIW